MRFLTAFIEGLVGFVQRNPLLVLIVVVLALGAPALLRGIALAILYFILGALILGAGFVLVIRWRIRRMQREMEDRMGEDFDRQARGGFNPFAGFGRGTSRAPRREGDVEVHAPRTPRKRVSDDVGDYVEFEETKD